LETTLARYDRIALAERRRRYVLSDFSFGSGCRCCYDPKLDGGDYTALTEARCKLQEQHQDLGYDDDEKNEPRYDQNCLVLEKEDDDSDDEYDYLLEEDDDNDSIQKMEEECKAEMYLAALTLESAVHHGFGTHRQIHPQYIVRATGLGQTESARARMTRSSVSPAIVLHLYDEMNPLSASLDLFLEKMAPQYKGTKFIRCNGRMAFIWNPNLARDIFPHTRHTLDPNELDRYLPCLIAIQDGRVVSSCYSLTGLGSMKLGGIDPSAVESWLHHSGVLNTQLCFNLEDLCRYRPEEEALHENMIRETERLQDIDNEAVFVCGLVGCQKNFPHEHIGIKTEEQKGLLVSEEITLGTEK